MLLVVRSSHILNNMIRAICLCAILLAGASANDKDKRIFGAGGFGDLGGGGGQGVGLGGVGGYGGVSDTCRYWCKTDVGQAYCCESGLEEPGLVGTKPGKCPPVRPTCPRFRAPQLCSNDGACGGIDKCCFDKCLGEHVCKPPLPGY